MYYKGKILAYINDKTEDIEAFYAHEKCDTLSNPIKDVQYPFRGRV